MLKYIVSSLKMLMLLVVICGVFYPLVITLASQLIFPNQANGSLIKVDNKIVGSELIGQNFEDSSYFWGRPSETSNQSMPSGGSNLARASKALNEKISTRQSAFATTNSISISQVPKEMMTASASGIDPHISDTAAYFQIDRIAKSRNLTNPQDIQNLQKLVHQNTEYPTWGFLGNIKVNVLKLNIALDKNFPIQYH